MYFKCGVHFHFVFCNSACFLNTSTVTFPDFQAARAPGTFLKAMPIKHPHIDKRVGWSGANNLMTRSGRAGQGNASRCCLASGPTCNTAARVQVHLSRPFSSMNLKKIFFDIIQNKFKRIIFIWACYSWTFSHIFLVVATAKATRGQMLI